jgi:hypothetical protein
VATTPATRQIRRSTRRCTLSCTWRAYRRCGGRCGRTTDASGCSRTFWYAGRRRSGACCSGARTTRGWNRCVN